MHVLERMLVHQRSKVCVYRVCHTHTHAHTHTHTHTHTHILNYPPEVNPHSPYAFMYDIIINYVEGEELVPLVPNATIVDKDNTTLVRLVTRLLNLYDQPLEVLSVVGDHPNIIVITVSSGTIPDYMYVMEQSCTNLSHCIILRRCPEVHAPTSLLLCHTLSAHHLCHEGL